MSTAKLAAKPRTVTGSAAARRLRAADHIPAVIYGHGMAPLSLTVERRDLRVALSGAAGANTVLTLDVDGTSYAAVIKEMQRHPIKRTVSHIDFQTVDMNETITVNVKVHLTGEAKAVLSNGGMVDPAVDHIEVHCTPANIPNEITVDISGMQLHDVIRLSDVKLPAGVTATGDADMAIVTAIGTAAGAADAAH
jgi:large subunit ribosomal protein L25